MISHLACAMDPQGMGSVLVQLVPVELSSSAFVLHCLVRSGNIVLPKKGHLKSNQINQFQLYTS